MSDTKPCAHCGATIARTNQGTTDWARRSYCSRACIWAARKQGETIETKPCLGCGGTIARNTKMSAGQWAGRRYCSRSCRRCRFGRCEVCAGPLPTARKKKLPWCSNPCKAAWQAAHPKEDRATRNSRDDADPPVRFRSDRLPGDAPNRRWVERHGNRFVLCCGYCLRRFPRDTIRQVERLRDLHAVYCKPARPLAPKPRPARRAERGPGIAWTPDMDSIVASRTASQAMAALGLSRGAVESRRRSLRRAA